MSSVQTVCSILIIDVDDSVEFFLNCPIEKSQVQFGPSRRSKFDRSSKISTRFCGSRDSVNLFKCYLKIFKALI